MSSQPLLSTSSTSPEVAVRCLNVVREFGEGDSRLRVLHGVDVDIRVGEMTMLVGPSGCGKTTLISIVCGLLNPTAGDVELFGVSRRELVGKKLVEFRGRNIGFVFQQYNLLPALTAAENVAVPLIIAGVSRKEAISRGMKTLDRVGLNDRAHHLPSQLSGGQQQRVAIARALVHEPRLLVCDEPTSALDAQSGLVVMDILRNVALQSNRSVLIVSHDPRVMGFGDRIITMSDGRVDRVETQTREAVRDLELVQSTNAVNLGGV